MDVYHKLQEKVNAHTAGARGVALKMAQEKGRVDAFLANLI